MTRDRVVAVVSGGLDSVTMAYLLAPRYDAMTLLSVDYGQRHARELSCAALAATRLGADHVIADLRSVGALLAGSALTDPSVPVPEGHYAHESMRATVVPNRNAILLSVATGVAVSTGASVVAFGAHAGDHPIYPDCRPEFVEAFENLARVANEGFVDPRFAVEAPFLRCTKADIVATGARLDVPFADTWSCYVGGDAHCGRCGTCVERREAFAAAGVTDPTTYTAETAVDATGEA